MRTFTNLLKTELKLNIRNMNMVIFAVIMPVVVLVVLGIIYQSRPAYPGAEYTFLEQSMSAVCTISIGAGGLMGLPIVVSEYRERKILKRFQVTPVSPVMLLVVEFTIYVLYALVSMVLLGSGVSWELACLYWELVSYIDFYLKYRHDGRRDCKRYENSQRYSQYPVFPYVDIFRSNCTV